MQLQRSRGYRWIRIRLKQVRIRLRPDCVRSGLVPGGVLSSRGKGRPGGGGADTRAGSGEAGGGTGAGSEVGCEVIGLCMNVEEGKGANSDQLDPPRLDLLDCGRQAGQGGNDEVLGSLPEGGGREGVAKRGCQGRNSIVGVNFLKKDQVRLGLHEDGVEAAEVGPLVGVEGEDG